MAQHTYRTTQIEKRYNYDECIQSSQTPGKAETSSTRGIVEKTDKNSSNDISR